MDYHAHYDRLISRARSRVLEGYSEGHHVVPRCLGGSDDPSNIVHLTGEEHFVAHLLLVKMHPKNPSLAWAAHMMTVKSRTHTESRSRNKLYGWLRRRISSDAKKRTGKKNGSFGTRWITDGTANQKIAVDASIPNGWRTGRILKAPVFATCRCGQSFISNHTRNRRFCSIKCGRAGKQAPNKGTSVSEKTRLKISASLKALTGERASQYGTWWIHHPVSGEVKKIKKDDFGKYHENGFVRGRRINRV